VCLPGQPADALWLVQGGFARITGEGPVTDCTEGFLRPGEMFGLAELVAGWRAGQPVARRQGLRALGTLDLLRIPLTVMRQVFAEVDAALLPQPESDRGDTKGDDTGLVDFLVDHRYLNGRAAMLIDLDRCTRCDDCVRACASAHEGNPRFVRDGRQHGSTLIAHACMHCVDPVCLVGCPTGAIHRSALDGSVNISEPACIGCSSCADSCPYGNIRMITLQGGDGQPLVDDSGTALRKASSCDLCSEQRSGPACQTACPYDALLRVDIGDQQAIRKWLAR
jgi:Fe-S-cluster-containing dehydrogenase component